MSSAKALLIITILSLGVFMGVGKSWVEAAIDARWLDTNLIAIQSGNINAGLELIADYNQVFVEINGQRQIITSDRASHSQPVVSGTWVIWSGLVDSHWQIFRHDLISNRTLQLTNNGNHVHPVAGDGLVAWQGQVDGIWQAFIFDGVRVVRVSIGDYPVEDISTRGGRIVYAQKHPQVGWGVWVYDHALGQTNLVSGTGFAKKPEFIANNIVRWRLRLDDDVTAFSDYHLETLESLASTDTQTLDDWWRFQEASESGFLVNQEVSNHSLRDTLIELGIIDTSGKVASTSATLDNR